jgi:predicted HTH domain antitoxin/ribosomal protein S18 acetylase RimI-like enzyme
MKIKVPEPLTDRDAKLAVAIEALTRNLVSTGMAAEIAEIPIQELLAELKKRGIPAYPYTDEEIKEELKKLEEITTSQRHKIPPPTTITDPFHTTHAMTTTRPATKDDLDTILTFRKRLQRHLTDSNPRIWRRNMESDALRDEALEEITGPARWTIIAEHNHAPIGHISGRVVTRTDEEPATIGAITTMWVEPNHRNRGVGTTLVRSLLDKLTQAGAQDITLRIVNGNAEAQSFWAGLGFQPTITVANAEPSRVLEAINRIILQPDKTPDNPTMRMLGLAAGHNEPPEKALLEEVEDKLARQKTR